MKRLIPLSLLLAVGLSAGVQTATVTTTGTTSWTVPATVTSVQAECWGSGGAGGSGNGSSPGWGGGGGAYARKNAFTVTPGQVLTVNVSAGGFWTYVRTAGSVYLCQAETGAAGSTAGPGAAGLAIDSTGDVKIDGTAASGTSVSAGNCGAAGGAGANGGGAGGSVGCGWIPPYTIHNGGNGGPPGGGGGGGDPSGTGGSGARGQVTFTYTVNTAPVAVSVSGIPSNINYGVWFTATFVCRDADGYTDISNCQVIMGGAVDYTQDCNFVYFWDNSVGVLNDAQSSWQNSTVGTGGIVSSTNCSLNIAASSTSRSGTDVTIYAVLRYLPGLMQRNGGLVDSWMTVTDASSVTNGGWQSMTTGAYIRTGPKLIVTNQ